jgi:beta-lactam-binding protein with PASTA domain
MVTVPELKGKSLTDARKALTRLGLRISYTPPNANENYWVLVQDPPAGRKVKRGTVVNLELQVPIY